MSFYSLNQNQDKAHVLPLADVSSKSLFFLTTYLLKKPGHFPYWSSYSLHFDSWIVVVSLNTFLCPLLLGSCTLVFRSRDLTYFSEIFWQPFPSGVVSIPKEKHTVQLSFLL